MDLRPPQNTGEPHPQPDQPQHRPNPLRAESRAFAAREEDEVVGFALASLADYGPVRYGTIDELIVEKQHRREGIGTELINQCLDWLEQQQANLVYVYADNDETKRFYEKDGFESCSNHWLCRRPGGPKRK